jgi:hypothetical protein
VEVRGARGALKTKIDADKAATKKKIDNPSDEEQE